MIIDVEDYLAHYGIIRRSGRYPWGSGDNKQLYTGTFVDVVRKLRQEGLTDPEIARGFEITTTQLRAAHSIETNRIKQEKIRQAQKLKDAGNSVTAIGREMGINESSVRSLLAPGAKDRADNLQTIASLLKDDLDKNGGYLQIGSGVENLLGVSDTKLKTAVAILEEQGYKKINIQEDQLGTANQKTTVRVLAPPGTTYRDVVAHKDQIRLLNAHSKDGGRTFTGPKPPLNIDPNRIKVRYKEDGGDEADGVIYVRPGVDDINLGGSNYAQVRIAVGGSHYLKGMAVYKSDLPKGVDLEFNTNKSSTGNKLDAMKKMQKTDDGKVDLANPFGSEIKRQILDPSGKKPTSAMNIVNEEGDWGNWSKTISTQVLSKQPPKLAEQQLQLSYERKRADLDEIKSLTNPTVRKKLLEAYADGADASAVHLKAAHLPRQATHVILPLKSLKETEVYAPNYNNGEVVALIRYPHGGKFEIPELRVNNSNREGKAALGTKSPDAIGINPKVAARLSGADFDGDTVVVIPNNNRQIRSEPALKALKDFDPQRVYKPYDGMKTIDGGKYNAKTREVEFPPGKKPNSRAKGTQMGLVSNLITDMTIKGATPDELARAVKHSMVVIDAEKHSLDYKASYNENGIRALNVKYQGKPGGGSATLISRATSKTLVDATKPRSPKDGGPIDPKTGRLMTVPHTYVDKNGVTRTKKVRVDKLANTRDARTLISDDNTKIERVYADHSNRLKSLADEARKEVAAFRPPRQDKSAKTAFKPEVESLIAKLNVARSNKPLERQAQILANAVVQQRIDANPLMDPSDLKKIKSQALATARARTGASKTKIVPTPKEWAAIQAGAISQNQLKQILDNADLDAIRTLATPRSQLLMTSTKTQRAKAMAAAGFTQAEIASNLGVSLTTLKTALND